jgi:hypothetical protein
MAPSQPKTHFHIFWASRGKMDWQRFENRETAERWANDLVLQDEWFTIHELPDEMCSYCNPNVRE